MRVSRVRPLRTSIPIHVGDRTGRVLDVSRIGLRFELDWPPEDEVPSAMTLTIANPSVTVPVIVVWKLQEGRGPWICGAIVAADRRAEWRRLLATAFLTDGHEARTAASS